MLNSKSVLIDWSSYTDIANKTVIGAAAFGPQNASGLDCNGQVSLNVNGCGNGYRKVGLTGANVSLYIVGFLLYFLSLL